MHNNFISNKFHSCMLKSSKHTSLASITVPTPTVRAWDGTLDKSPPKNLALSFMVSCANVLTRVRELKDDPGSLKAM